MMKNDELGDCTIAACGHAIQVWTANVAVERTPADDVVLAAYEKWCGYDPSNPSTDAGGYEPDVLNSWRKDPVLGCLLTAYADAGPDNVDLVKQCIWLFGGVYIGLALPAAWQDSEVWDAVNGSSGVPGSWGGHAVFCPRYDESGITCVTWGGSKPITWAGWLKYCDECHVLLNPVWMNKDGQAPSRFNYAQLETDLVSVAGA